MKYVEAMISTLRPFTERDPAPFSPGTRGDLIDAIESGEHILSKWSDLGMDNAPVRELIKAAESLLEEIGEHECGADADDEEDGPFVPVSHPDSIRRQLETALFLPGEEVAIIRLSDLKALMEHEKILNEHLGRLSEALS